VSRHPPTLTSATGRSRALSHSVHNASQARVAHGETTMCLTSAI
jgi:hypothetical protein